ncbi:MAG TPA: hypothetical protein VNE60_06805 [Gemmatimonadaceae bacterium]|nr:hypothetical protein [Gemmatimonadaceae bacterium]
MKLVAIARGARWRNAVEVLLERLVDWNDDWNAKTPRAQVPAAEMVDDSRTRARAKIATSDNADDEDGGTASAPTTNPVAACDCCS